MTPTLRELTHTAPYMHNGTLATLADVVEFYELGGGEHRNKDVLLQPLELVPSQKADLVAFLEALSGDTFDTPFDNYMRGDNEALNASQKRGLELFSGKAGCMSCHSGALLSDEQFHNVGVPPYSGWETNELAQITFRFELYAKGSTKDMYLHTKDDPGLYFRSKDKRHKGKFRTPSLRYTKYTQPFMHNGMLATLRDVVEFYNAGGGVNEFAETKSPLIQPLGLSDLEIDDIVAFLESLSGEQILMDAPPIPPMEALGAAQ